MEKRHPCNLFENLPEILIREDLEKILPYSHTYLQKLLAERRLPSRKLGRRHIIFKRDLVEWLEGLS